MLKSALKIYFTHWNNLLYIGLFLLGLVYSLNTGAFQQYWYLLLLILLASPFVEYYAHKYLLHLPYPREPEKHPRYAWFLDRIHYLHHQDPKKIEHIFAEWWLIAISALFDFGLIYLISGSLEITILMLTGIIFYYLFYEWTHFIAHYDYQPHNAYGRYMKKYHVWHHYKNEDYWYGITSPLGDMLFGKFKDPKTIEPSAMALRNRGRL